MLRRLHISISVLFISFIIFGCGKDIPKDIISPDKMENILYDYHLAKVMGDRLPSDQYYKRDLYLNYVFKKYKITNADFDSSMVWYTKHADELTRIYLNIDKRYKKNGDNIKAATAYVAYKNKKTLPSDSTDIWNLSDLYWLTSSDITNKMTFNIVADTSYRQNDLFIFQGDYNFIKDGKQNAVMAINMILDNDSVIGRTQVINSKGHYRINLRTNAPEYKIRSINGFIYYKGDSKLPGMLVSNISLIKRRINDKETLSSDSLKSVNSSDTIAGGAKNPDTLLTRPISNDPAVIGLDTTPITQPQPVRNDPRSIRDRNPKKSNLRTR